MGSLTDQEIRSFIARKYKEILFRESDIIGLEHYFSCIKSGEIKLDDLEDILRNSQEYNELVKGFNITPIPEPDYIFITCFNHSTGQGGLLALNKENLDTIYDETGCYGCFYQKKHELLFCVTREKPQIICFRKENNKFIRVNIHFENYIFGYDAHGIYVSEHKIYIVASDGEPDSEKATNKDGPGNKVGKIIVSEINIERNTILIKNSFILNPFSCLHHHHINDIIMIDNSMYFTSFSYCKYSRDYTSRGAVSELNKNNECNVILDGFEQPHSLILFRDRFYFCSSNLSTIYSFDLLKKNLRVEYKGPDAYIRGLLITDDYFYIGISESIGRTNSRFNKQACRLLRFNKNTGETTIIQIPSTYNNVYSIISDQ